MAITSQTQAVVAMLGGVEAMVAMLKRVNRRYHDSVTLVTSKARPSLKSVTWGSRKMSLKEDAIEDFQVWMRCGVPSSSYSDDVACS